MHRGYSENPSVETFLKGTLSLRVLGSVAGAPNRGNYSREEQKTLNDSVDNTLLSKQRRRTCT